MSAIGNVQTIYLKSLNQVGEEFETNITGNYFTVNYDATFKEVDTAMRALNSLTTNTYQDTMLITPVSVNEKLMEEEG